MKPQFSAIALTLFPEMFPGPLGQSLAGTALKNGLWSLQTINIRDFAIDRHRTVDDRSYGGGTGMVMKPEIVDAAIAAAKTQLPGALCIYLTPRGIPFTQEMAENFKDKGLILLCGRFEGVDQRVIEHHEMLEVSLGDFVLSGGEIAALALLDATVRLLPGVIGKEEAIEQESFSSNSNSAGLLEYPHYTRPSLWNGMAVPEVLMSGNHKQINAWRLAQSKEITARRRPDLIKKRGRNMNTLQKIEQENLAKLAEGKRIDKFNEGDTVSVNVRIIEGDSERIQTFEGVVIARRNAGVRSAFTVRKISHGEGVERVFPLYSPRLESIELIRKGNVRRAKLYYLRGRTGKAARITEKREEETVNNANNTATESQE